MGVLHANLQVEGGFGLVLSPPHLRLEPNPLTPINDAGALSHCIRDIGLKPSPELFVYFLGLKQEARLRLTGEKTLGSSGDRQCGFRARTLGLRSYPGPGMGILGQVTLFSPFIYFFLIIYLFLVNFVIHWNETAMGLHVFPIPIPPPTTRTTRSP